ncbi:hypothetical protein H9P43_000995 [Blastocladiella emersonii ATCC 22665]|nr:hypothetical protein H9P43_000995 [Blastocladiella emersonii ATCC 22665]
MSAQPSTGNDVLDFLDSLDALNAPPPQDQAQQQQAPPVAGMTAQLAGVQLGAATGAPNPFAPAVAPPVGANPFLPSSGSSPATGSPFAPVVVPPVAAGSPAPVLAPSPFAPAVGAFPTAPVPSPTAAAAPSPVPAPAPAPVASAVPPRSAAAPGHARTGSTSSLRGSNASLAAAGSMLPSRTASPMHPAAAAAAAATGATAASPRPTTPSLNPYTPAAPAAGSPPKAAAASPSTGGGWGSWFSSVTATVLSETATATQLVTKVATTAAKVGDGLRHDAGERAARVLANARAAGVVPTAADPKSVAAAGEKLLGLVSRSVTSVLDAVAPETQELTVSLRVAGVCNVAEAARDAADVLTAVFQSRDMRLIVQATDAVDLRPYIPEELATATVDRAVAVTSALADGPRADDAIVVAIHPARPAPEHLPALLTYLVRVHGAGAAPAVFTVSQSVYTDGPHADPEWDRMVLRSALRTAADDWLADLVAATSAAESTAVVDSEPVEESKPVDQDQVAAMTMGMI